MIKRVFVGMIALALMAGTVPAAEWEVDAAHTTIGFEVSHLVISSTTGKFKDFTGTVHFDGENLEKGKVEFTVNVGSVDTDNADRDGHLVSPDFFNAEEFPTMTFKSTKVVSKGSKKFQLIGDLTIKGVTKEVTFDCKFRGTAEFMEMTKAGFSAETSIDRQEFGVSWNKNLDAGGVVVGNEVDINLEVEVNQKAMASHDSM